MNNDWSLVIAVLSLIVTNFVWMVAYAHLYWRFWRFAAKRRHEKSYTVAQAIRMAERSLGGGTDD